MASSMMLIISLFAAIFSTAELIQLNGIKHYDVIDVERVRDVKQEDEHYDVIDVERVRDVKQEDEPHGNQNTKLDAYDDEVEYSFTGLGRHFHLNLRKNDVLVQPGARLIYQAADGSHNEEADPLENCYYQGELRDEGASSAVVSTCDGRLKGFLKDSNGVEYGIAPHPDEETKYVLYKESDVIQKRNATQYRCGYKDDEESADHEDDSGPQSSLFRSSHQNIEKRSIAAWKYIEVIPVVSNQLYKKFQKSERNQYALSGAIQRKVLQIFNHVDALYKTINTRMVVTNIIVWDRKNYGITPSLGKKPTLKHFTNYVRDEMFEKGLCYDHAALLTVDDSNWGTTIGYAYIGHMCNIDATSVNRIPLDDSDPQNADLLTHEIGHSVGFGHTNQCGSGKCANPPCVMKPKMSTSTSKGFSQCNVNKFKDLLGGGKLPCILEYPRKFLQRPTCGNGFVEEGEQCDCGSEQECRKQGLTACCDHSNCKLKRGAQCAAGACCDKCKFKSKINSCRAKAHPDCDLEEFCTGVSEHCPENTYRHAGTPCAGGTSYCFLDECKTMDAQCKKLWGPKAGKAIDSCFSLNVGVTNDPSSANCGKNDAGQFVKCADRDKFCGKLFCGPANPSISLPENPTIKGATFWTWNRSGTTCKTVVRGDNYRGMDTTDTTYVETGTKCGRESICVQTKCMHISTLVKKNCSPPCKGGSVCNNKGLCQCPLGARCQNIATDYDCQLKPGDGNTNGEKYAGKLTGDACVQKCWEMKKSNKKINGVVMYQNGKDGCWCELGMTRIDSSSKYKTCFFRKKTKVNGEWGDWGAYSACSAKCGGGTKKRSRSCDNPEPTKGGKPCAGSSTEVTSCNTQPCSSGCCNTIKLSLANSVQKKQSTRAGIYKLGGKTNGREYWVSSTNNQAIWYNQKLKIWAIGSFDDLGTTIRGIGSRGNLESQCPYDDKGSWKYWSGSAFKSTSDVHFECQRCCNTIKLSLANGVQKKQSTRAGTYKLGGKTNGREYWVSSTNNQAIWYNQKLKIWAIGSFDDLGTTMRGIGSRGNLESQCPYDDKGSWKYWSGSAFKSTSDVHFECQRCCNTIRVSLANGVQKKQSTRAGIYKLGGKTNGREYWVSSTNNQAIWYNQKLKIWAIGSFDDLGTTIRGIGSRGNLESQCPYDDKGSWKYWSGSAFKSTSDVHFECQVCCNIVKVSLDNDVQKKQSTRAGTYKLGGKTNGREYWVSSTNNQAIWYNQKLKIWAIGSFDDLGTTMRGIGSRGDLESQCPYDDRGSWKYWSGSAFKSTSDVHFECQEAQQDEQSSERII